MEWHFLDKKVSTIYFFFLQEKEKVFFILKQLCKTLTLAKHHCLEKRWHVCQWLNYIYFDMFLQVKSILVWSLKFMFIMKSTLTSVFEVCESQKDSIIYSFLWLTFSFWTREEVNTSSVIVAYAQRLK